MDSYDILATVQMLCRWVHVFAAILWIGQTYLFHLMDLSDRDRIRISHFRSS